MPRPVCLRCRKFLRVKKNGVVIEEGSPRAGGAWGPYKLWMGDLWRCPECGVEVIMGFGLKPLSEHFRRDYEATREDFRGDLLPGRVDDC